MGQRGASKAHLPSEIQIYVKQRIRFQCKYMVVSKMVKLIAVDEAVWCEKLQLIWCMERNVRHYSTNKYSEINFEPLCSTNVINQLQVSQGHEQLITI